MTTPTLRAWRALGVALAAALVLISCGGGVGTGGTGSFSSVSVGQITGYGSIIVNGVRYDVDGVGGNLSDDDGQGRSLDELKLGVVVQVEAGAITTTTTPPSAVATKVVIGSELLGVIDSVTSDAGGTTLRIAGQDVRVTPGGTLLDDRFTGGLADLVRGATVEVYGAFDAANARIGATRIEPKAATAAPRVRGPVSAITGNVMRIGASDYVAATLPAGVSVGAIVRLKLQATPDAQGRWRVDSFAGGGVTLPDADEAELEGRVTSVAGLPASFQINGVTVNAGAISTAGVVLGVKVEVEGTAAGGVITARKIELKGADDSGSSGGDGGLKLEFHGTLTALDAVARTFRLVGRTETFSYARSDVDIEGTLANGVSVEVKAVLGSDGVTIDATEIEVES